MKKDKRNKRKKRLQRKKNRHKHRVNEKSKFKERGNIMNMGDYLAIMVENNHAELVGTNYWETEMPKHGYFFLSINAGAFRLLVPENQEHVIEEFKTGEYCIISKGPSPSPIHPFMMELVFEDHTVTPYQLTICAGQVERNLPGTDAGKKFKLSVWTKGCKKVLEMDAYFRIVNRIPYLKPLGNEFKNVS